MTYAELISPAGNARAPDAQKGAKACTMGRQMGWKWQAAVLAGALGVGGCINLTTPTEPIVIELNINITQEVIYRLAEDASDAIDENADIF